ncbi:DUF6907 domain-containing protein [Kitasatospora cineracea]
MTHQLGRVDATTGEPSAAKCPALDGKCTETQPGHHDHSGPATLIQAPTGPNDAPIVEALLMNMSEPDGGSSAFVSFWWGNNATELTTVEAHHLADQLDQFAAQLRTLAAELQHITSQA